jgi:hypothetical protein
MKRVMNRQEYEAIQVPPLARVGVKLNPKQSKDGNNLPYVDRISCCSVDKMSWVYKRRSRTLAVSTSNQLIDQ